MAQPHTCAMQLFRTRVENAEEKGSGEFYSQSKESQHHHHEHETLTFYTQNSLAKL